MVEAKSREIMEENLLESLKPEVHLPAVERFIDFKWESLHPRSFHFNSSVVLHRAEMLNVMSMTRYSWAVTVCNLYTEGNIKSDVTQLLSSLVSAATDALITPLP